MCWENVDKMTVNPGPTRDSIHFGIPSGGFALRDKLRQFSDRTIASPAGGQFPKAASSAQRFWSGERDSSRPKTNQSLYFSQIIPTCVSIIPMLIVLLLTLRIFVICINFSKHFSSTIPPHPAFFSTLRTRSEKGNRYEAALKAGGGQMAAARSTSLP